MRTRLSKYFSESTSFDINVDANQDSKVKRSIEDVLEEIKGHLTKEELLFLSLFKNSPRQSNVIHRYFLKKYYGRVPTSAAITKKKRRLFNVLGHIGRLLRFKKAKNVDLRLKTELTTKQYQILMLYERRKEVKEICRLLNLKPRAIKRRYMRALKRVEESTDKVLAHYLKLYQNVLQYSRKNSHTIISYKKLISR